MAAPAPLPPPDPSEMLAARARRGDSGAFEELYRLHHRRIYALALRMARDPGLAEEMTQEAFVTAWGALPSFRGESAFGTWLHGLAARVILRQMRTDRRREERHEAIADSYLAEARRAMPETHLAPPGRGRGGAAHRLRVRGRTGRAAGGAPLRGALPGARGGLFGPVRSGPRALPAVSQRPGRPPDPDHRVPRPAYGGTPMIRRIVLFFASIFVIISACALVAGAQESCPEGHPVTGDLGISHLLCVGGSCSVNLRTGRGYAHDFSTEPRIQGLEKDGPAWGRLQDRDILVAIDGVLITTLEGGRRLANLTPGKPVELRIRRGGRDMDVTVVPRTGCNMPMLAVRQQR